MKQWEVLFKIGLTSEKLKLTTDGDEDLSDVTARFKILKHCGLPSDADVFIMDIERKECK